MTEPEQSNAPIVAVLLVVGLAIVVALALFTSMRIG